MKLAVVIPATQGREENLRAVLDSLDRERLGPVIVVDDGCNLDFNGAEGDHLVIVRLPKHAPGAEQPRNVGARWAKMLAATHVWFVDSDVILAADAAEHITAALEDNGHRVLVGPYDWLRQGLRPDAGGFWSGAIATRNDPRWAMFDTSGPEREYHDDLSAGLACFSGNLVWPIEEFERVGGFWSEIHHGRCEDGELGLRAVSMEVPISFIAKARGFHLWHPVNMNLAIERNTRDVPMLNARHPWVQGTDVFLSDRDGAAFDVRCKCGDVVPTVGWWEHAAGCASTEMELPT